MPVLFSYQQCPISLSSPLGTRVWWFVNFESYIFSLVLFQVFVQLLPQQFSSGFFSAVAFSLVLLLSKSSVFEKLIQIAATLPIVNAV